ncbi:hypothetical protein BDB13_5432 [Rhodococcus sp. OK302]|nr:hypothetical protein BDB13_5432 [Rhodococcus sp. OK302]
MSIRRCVYPPLYLSTVVRRYLSAQPVVVGRTRRSFGTSFVRRRLREHVPENARQLVFVDRLLAGILVLGHRSSALEAGKLGDDVTRQCRQGRHAVADRGARRRQVGDESAARNSDQSAGQARFEGSG